MSPPLLSLVLSLALPPPSSSSVFSSSSFQVPANCDGLCGVHSGGCPGQFDTANLNNYVFANNNGAGPAYANLCVRAPEGKNFVDGEYHTCVPFIHLYCRICNYAHPLSMYVHHTYT